MKTIALALFGVLAVASALPYGGYGGGSSLSGSSSSAQSQSFGQGKHINYKNELW